MGKPCLEGQEVLCVLDATYNQPFGLPNSFSSRRDDAMANASLVGGCAAASCGQLGTNTYFLHKQEVLASRSCASAVPDAACLVGLPTRCQFQYETFLRTKEVGLPISDVLNHSLHSSCAPWVGDFNGRDSVFLAFTATWVGALLALLSALVVLGWGLFFLLCPFKANRKRKRKRSKNKPKLGSHFQPLTPLLRNRLVCRECRWVGKGKGRMRRLKGPRVAFRDRQWAFANRRLGAWVQGKGASRAQAAALAASPRRQQTRQGQLWQWTHRGKNERGPAPNPEGQGSSPQAPLPKLPVRLGSGCRALVPRPTGGHRHPSKTPQLRPDSPRRARPGLHPGCKEPGGMGPAHRPEDRRGQ